MSTQSNRSTRAQALIDVLRDRPIAYHPRLVKPLGGINETVFVCQLLYWDGKGGTPGGWIYKTMAEWEEETGLTRYNQETVRKNLIELGVLEEQRRGVPGRMHFRLRFDRLSELVEQAYPDPHNVGTPQCGNPTMWKPHKQECGNPTNKNAGIPHCNSEITPETTSESTEEKDPAAPAADNPAQKRLARLRAHLGEDPLTVAANSAKAQADAGGSIWTVPVEAGGTDHAGALMLAEWFEAKGVDLDVVPEQAAERFQASMSKLAASLEGITPEQAARAVEIVLNKDNPEFSYYTYSDPAVEKFKRDWTDVALRLLSGQPGYLTAQDPTQSDAPIPVNEPYELPATDAPTELDQLWARCLGELRLQCTLDVFARWYANSRLLSLANNIATLAVRDDHAADWIEGRLAPQVVNVLGPMTGLDPGAMTLHCTVVDPPARSPPAQPSPAPAAQTVMRL